MLQAVVLDVDRQVLPRFEVRHPAAVHRCQHEAADHVALRLFLQDAERAQIAPAAVVGFALLINLLFTLDKYVGQHAVGFAPGVQDFLAWAEHFVQRRQQMTTDDVVLLRLDIEAGVSARCAPPPATAPPGSRCWRHRRRWRRTAPDADRRCAGCLVVFQFRAVREHAIVKWAVSFGPVAASRGIVDFTVAMVWLSSMEALLVEILTRTLMMYFKCILLGSASLVNTLVFVAVFFGRRSRLQNMKKRIVRMRKCPLINGGVSRIKALRHLMPIVCVKPLSRPIFGGAKRFTLWPRTQTGSYLVIFS